MIAFLWLTLACSSTPDPPPSPVVDTPTAPTAPTTPTTPSTETSPDRDSACTMKGPFHGKLQGVALEEGLSLANAKARCLEIAHDCSGITSQSSPNGPFSAIQALVSFDVN